MLDVLKAKGAQATFFLIGSQAHNDPGFTRRIYAEGHEIGNHTWNHPDISNIAPYMGVELNLTERYSPANSASSRCCSVRPTPSTRSRIPPTKSGPWRSRRAWATSPSGRKSIPMTGGIIRVAQRRIANSVLEAPAALCAEDGQKCGNIILLHDGGGDRRETVRALPLIIDGLRARGYQIVPVSQLLGKSRPM